MLPTPCIQLHMHEITLLLLASAPVWHRGSPPGLPLLGMIQEIGARTTVAVCIWFVMFLPLPRPTVFSFRKAAISFRSAAALASFLLHQFAEFLKHFYSQTKVLLQAHQSQQAQNYTTHYKLQVSTKIVAACYTNCLEYVS